MMRDFKLRTKLAAGLGSVLLLVVVVAASAGEAGKGFAVVVNEVKELAKQTAVATGQIEHQIKEMQANTASAVAAIEGITEVVTEVNNITLTIASAVEKQAATTNEIARSMAGASQAAGERSPGTCRRPPSESPRSPRLSTG